MSVGRTRTAVAWLLRVTAENAGGAVYGTITVGVLLAAEDARREGYPATIEAALVVLVLFWLTSFYAHALGVRLRRREPLTANLLWHSCVHELPILEGALMPVVVLLVAWAVGESVNDGVSDALWTAAGTIVVLEVAAGWRSRLRSRAFLIQAGVGAVLGLALIGLKIVLHH